MPARIIPHGLITLSDRLELRHADLLDQLSLIKLLEEIQPDEVYNLAAMLIVPTS